MVEVVVVVVLLLLVLAACLAVGAVLLFAARQLVGFELRCRSGVCSCCGIVAWNY